MHAIFHRVLYCINRSPAVVAGPLIGLTANSLARAWDHTDTDSDEAASMPRNAYVIGVDGAQCDSEGSMRGAPARVS